MANYSIEKVFMVRTKYFTYSKDETGDNWIRQANQSGASQATPPASEVELLEIIADLSRKPEGPCA